MHSGVKGNEITDSFARLATFSTSPHLQEDVNLESCTFRPESFIYTHSHI